MADLRDSLLRALAAKMDAGEGMSVMLPGMPWHCCPGARKNSVIGCTCWIPIYDQQQTDPDDLTIARLALGQATPDVRDRMCGDCAYRPGSPEKTGSPDHDGDATQLEQLAATGTRFYCHDGMRQPVRWFHPAGITIPAVIGGDYQPPQVLGVPYRADGRPGLLCAGWDARRRALQAKAAP